MKKFESAYLVDPEKRDAALARRFFPESRITRNTIATCFALNADQVTPSDVESIRAKVKDLSPALVDSVLTYKDARSETISGQLHALKDAFRSTTARFQWHDLVHAAVAKERALKSGDTRYAPPFYEHRYDGNEEVQDRDELRTLLFPVSPHGGNVYIRILNQLGPSSFETALDAYHLAVLDKTLQRPFTHVRKMWRNPDTDFKAQAERIYENYRAGNTRIVLDEFLGLGNSAVPANA